MVPGGASISESHYVDGCVFRKNVAHKAMTGAFVYGYAVGVAVVIGGGDADNRGGGKEKVEHPTHPHSLCTVQVQIQGTHTLSIPLQTITGCIPRPRVLLLAGGVDFLRFEQRMASLDILVDQARVFPLPLLQR